MYSNSIISVILPLICLLSIGYADIVTREIVVVKDEDREARARLARMVKSQFPLPNRGPVAQLKEWNETDKIETAKRVARTLAATLQSSGTYKLASIGFAVKCSTPSVPHVLMKLNLTKYCTCYKEPCLSSCSSTSRPHVVCIWEGTAESSSDLKTIGSVCYEESKVTREDKIELPNDICGSWEYGNTPLIRLAIPSDLKQWSAKMLLYKPPVFGMSGSRSLADGDEYEDKKLPRNPEGRTGVCGQGLLRSMGKNEMNFPIIIRKRKRNVREILIYQTYDRDKLGPIPEFYQKSNDENTFQPEPSATDYLYRLVKNASCSEKMFRKMFSSSGKIYSGYLPHPLSTDNAWIVGNVYVIKETHDTCLNAIDVFSADNYLNLKWKNVNASHIKTVPELVEAVFPNAAAQRIQKNPFRTLMILSSPLPLLTIFILMLVQFVVPFPLFLLLPLIALLSVLQIGTFAALKMFVKD
uniref:Uncharacterized protein n=1 Tax=Trichuris muris TaxID=70415 RepID=A0A5S6Q964_TRIMR